jgi:nucleotide-binding universal stress UspA family protein
MYQRILLAVDGSSTSNAALREAAKLVSEGAQLHIITITEDPFLVFASPYGVGYTFPSLREAIIEEGRQVLLMAQLQLAELGIKADIHVVDLGSTGTTNIPEAILNYADRWEADLIVLGTHGRQGVKRFFLGSVAEYVVRTSHKPVLLVRDNVV